MYKEVDKVAIYCRLSKEDEDKINRGDDSESIKNQKLFLVNYATSNNMMVYRVYSDDDFAGSDIDRPEWNKMIQDAKNGEFNIILCKSQSRFARSLETVERYINGLFLEWGIRFISIVDGIDNSVGHKTSQIHGLTDQWYLEDLSKNIRDTFRNKMKAGQFLGAFACYGYKKDPNDKHKIIIDEEAAKVVRKIYKLYLDGYSIKNIALILSEENIPTPTQYKQSSGLNYKNNQATDLSIKYGLWATTTIRRILTNKTYLGYLIQGREKKVSYKSEKVIVTPEEEWVVIPNSHEAIIDRLTFKQVQELMKSKRTVSSNGKNKRKAHCLAGKIKCRECGSSMVKTGGSSRKNNPLGYVRCSLAHKTRNKECSPHSMNLTMLIEHVEKETRKLISDTLNSNQDNEYLRQKLLNQNSNSDRIKSKTQEERAVNNKIEDLNNAVSLVYIDRAKGIITDDDFIKFKNNFDNQILNLKKDLKAIRNEIEEIKIEIDNPVDIIGLARKHTNFKKLTSKIVNEFIDYIEIGEVDIYGNRRIDIYWRD